FGAFEAAQELGDRALERAQRGNRACGRLARALVGAVASALDQPEVADVARDRRLSGRKPGLLQPAAHLFLAAQRLTVDQFEDQTLTTGLHRVHSQRSQGTVESGYTILTRSGSEYSSIFIDPNPLSVYKYSFRCILSPTVRRRQAPRTAARP